MNQAMDQLRALQKQLFALRYAQNLIEYDASTVAPKEGWPGRGEALEVLSGQVHALLTNPELPRLFADARAAGLAEQEAAEVQELERQHTRLCRIPAQEYAAFTKLTTAAVNVWEKAKAASDFALFAPYLAQIVETRRRFAGYFNPDKPVYDVWLDYYEDGLDTAQCDAFFDTLAAALTPLVRRIVTEGKAPEAGFLQGDWPVEQQRELSAWLMERLGTDPGHCRLGESEHPFTDELYKGDVRLTTHYHAEDMASSMYSVIHETGHALYELHTADRLMYTCLAGGASMGLHESQSRLFENYFGRSLVFIQCLMPKLQELFPTQLANVSAEAFYKAMNRCEPSLIRTEADEVTYCLHILVRYRLEKQLMEGSLAVADLPAAWNAQMQEILGVTVPSDAQGVLQDIHWAGGDFGYFPSYALGTAYAAQMVEAMERELDLNALLKAGEFAPINAWLTEKLWQYGKERSPAWLLQNACGNRFDPRCYTDYLTQKYTRIYGL